MTPKKVLIFSLAYYPFVGGAEVAIKEITDRISPDEFEFHMVTARFDKALPKSEKVGNVFVHRIGFAKMSPNSADFRLFPLHLNKYIFQILAFLKGAALHRTHHFDGMWAMMAHSAGIPAGLFKTFYRDVFYVLTLQEGDPPEYIERTMLPAWPLFVRGFALADHLVGESSFLEKWGRKMGFKGKSSVVPNGVDVEKFKTQIEKHKTEELRKSLKIQEKDKALITTSRLVKKNAVDDVIKALRYLPETVHFIVLGVGPDERMLKKLAEDVGVSRRVHFLGFIDGKKVPPYLKSSDIFVRPSLSEGMGNSFIEAMAAGIPVIGTAVGGIVDFLKDRETGFICGVKDPKSVADQVDFIINPKHKEAISTIVKNAREVATEKHDWNKIANTMKHIFETAS
ncbi:MAG: glycosyltransferase family 4 protein [Parcubacteria group bacterium]|nr:glycosyltransferase family 4 protein [Parcubacteria group bacterium]